MSAVIDIDDEIEENEELALGGAKTGRKESPYWVMAFGSERPIATVKAELQSTCKHCGQMIKHHKKCQIVGVHLNGCANFRQTVEEAVVKMHSLHLSGKG